MFPVFPQRAARSRLNVLPRVPVISFRGHSQRVSEMPIVRLPWMIVKGLFGGISAVKFREDHQEELYQI